MPGLLCKAWWKYRTAAQTPDADGRWNVSMKREFSKSRGKKENLQDSKRGRSGINRTGKKLKEVNIQTHQWKKKNQVADREHI